MSDGTIEVIFGDGTDSDTFNNVFGHLIGYVVGVNGFDIQIEHTSNDEGVPGLLGLIWNDELGEAEPGNERFFDWEHIRRVVIY